jgi:hypothetical protein
MTFMMSRRSLGLLIAATVAGGTAGTANAQAKSWSGGTVNWGTGANWSPAGVPGAANQVFIGNLPAVENETVLLNVNAAVGSLTITDGMSLSSQNAQLIVTGATLLSGQNQEPGLLHSSALFVLDGPAASDVVLGSLTLEDGADLYIYGGTLVVSGFLDLGPSSYTSAGGLIRLASNSAVAMRVDGFLNVGLPNLTISQEGSGRIDLDGSVAGDGTIFIDGMTQDGTEFARLTLIGQGLLDTMDDNLRLGPGNELTMTLDEGWTLGAAASVDMVAGMSDLPALLTGSHVTWRGYLSVSDPRAQHPIGPGAKGRIEAPVTFESTAVTTIDTGALLTCTNLTTLVGGEFSLDENANIDFQAETVVHDPTFQTFSEAAGDGTIDFSGPTVFDGTMIVHGNARQNGDATVVGPTVIDALRFDFDGAFGTTAWSISNALVLTIGDHLDAGNDIFNGSINISGTFLGKLTVNLPDPDGAWIMDGSMALGGVAAIMTTRVAGSDLRVTGDLDITNRVRLDCETRIGPDARVDFGSTSARLRLAQDSSITADAIFVGGGRLESEAGATLELEAGLDFLTCHLWNAGTLLIGDGPGLVSASSITLEPSSTWQVAIGGSTNGEWDRIGAGNPCTIGGTLDIRLVDLGSGAYEPPVGKSFAILQASGANSIAGSFATILPSFVPGKVYHWEASTTSTQSTIVTVTVASILPCPGEVTGDGVVDAADLAVLLGAWGPCSGCDADFDGDGAVGGTDLAVLLGAWGACD